MAANNLNPYTTDVALEEDGFLSCLSNPILLTSYYLSSGRQRIVPTAGGDESLIDAKPVRVLGS